MSVHTFTGNRAPELPAGSEPPTIHPMEARVTALETKWDAVIPTLATKADMADLRSDMHKGFADQTKWIIGTGVAGIAVFVTLTTFVLNNAVPKVAPAAQQQPIIINVPGAVAPALRASGP